MIQRKLLLELLEAELPDLESQVIQDIMDYSKDNRRASQKAVSEQFGVTKAQVKTIFYRMKEENANEMDIDMNSSQSAAANELASEFSSIGELKEFFGALAGEGSKGRSVNRSPSLVDMLADTAYLSDDSPQSMAEKNDENVDDEVVADVTPGEQLLDYVKWYIDSSSAEISSLRTDQELFDAQKNNLNEQIYNLRETVSEKDGKITALTTGLEAADAEKKDLSDQIHNLQEAVREKDEKITALTSELEKADAARKTNLCIRCNDLKKIVVAGMHFCSIECIKKASIDLRGGRSLPTIQI